MESIDAKSFTSQIESYEKLANEIEHVSVKGKNSEAKVGELVSKFTATVEKNASLCMLQNAQFTHLLCRIKNICDTEASPETREKMENLFEKVISPQMKDFTVGMTSFCDKLAQANQFQAMEAFTLPPKGDSIKEVATHLNKVLENPTNLLLLMQHGDNKLISETLLMCNIDISKGASDGTLLHHALKGNFPPVVISRLIEHGVPPNRPNSQGESPLMLAARGDNLAAVKALVRGGATIDLNSHLLSIPDLKPDMVKYLHKQVLKDVTSNLAKANESILFTPPRKGGFGLLLGTVMPQVITQAPGIATMALGKEATEGVGAIHMALPMLKGAHLSSEYSMATTKNENLEEKIEQLNDRLNSLGDEILTAKESHKKNLIAEQRNLKKEVADLEQLGRHQQRSAEVEVIKRGVDLQQAFRTGIVGLVGNFSGSTLMADKMITAAGASLASALSIFQTWNTISDIETKMSHLEGVKVSLNSAHQALRTVHSQMDPNTMEARLIQMKMGNIENKIAFIDKQTANFSKQGIAVKASIIGTTVACGLLAYGTATYWDKLQGEGDKSPNINALVDSAGHIRLVSGLLPVIGPSLATGASWLWNKGLTTFRGKTETDFEKEIKLDAEAEKGLTNEASQLQIEYDNIQEELEVGHEIAFAVFDKPQKGSPEYNNLMNRAAEIEQRQAEIPLVLDQYSTAKALNMSRRQVEENFAAIEQDLQLPEKKDLLKSIIEATGIDITEFDSNPRKYILKYLTQ